MTDTLYRIVWESVSPDITQKIISGCAKIAPNGGVVYEGGRILTHLPLKAVEGTASLISGGPLSIVNTVSNLATNAQLKDIKNDISQIKENMTSLLSLGKANMMVTVCSSAVVVGAIILSTMYLSKKIDELNSRLSNIEAIIREIGRQQLYEHINRYYGLLGLITCFIDRDKDSLENDIKFQGLLADLSKNRATLLSTCHDVKNRMINTPSKESAHICYKFIEDTLHTLPYGMMVEYSLYCKLEEFLTADRYAASFVEHYNRLKHDILEHAFNEKKKVILGRSSTLNLDMNILKNSNKIGIDEYILAIPQGVPVQLKALEEQNKKFYIPR